MTAAPQNGVLIAGVRCRLGGAPVLDGVDLAVADGELLTLIGPSGSGKTTLLRVLAGLERTDAGTVAIGGADMAGVPAPARGIGVVFQHQALFPHMTVAANIAFGPEMRVPRPDKAALAARIAALLALVGLDGLGDRHPTALSGGQRQRVALARALAIEPRLLLLDEPFGALDAPVRRELRGVLRDLHDRLGLTTILVTHDQDEALALGDQVAVMNLGRIEQVAPPEMLLAAPATSFVRTFLDLDPRRTVRLHR